MYCSHTRSRQMSRLVVTLLVLGATADPTSAPSYAPTQPETLYQPSVQPTGAPTTETAAPSVTPVPTSSKAQAVVGVLQVTGLTIAQCIATKPILAQAIANVASVSVTKVSVGCDVASTRRRLTGGGELALVLYAVNLGPDQEEEVTSVFNNLNDANNDDFTTEIQTGAEDSTIPEAAALAETEVVDNSDVEVKEPVFESDTPIQEPTEAPTETPTDTPTPERPPKIPPTLEPTPTSHTTTNSGFMWPTYECHDTNGDATDSIGDGCDWYLDNQWACPSSGKWDDDDFIAEEMCCGCGGGTLTAVPTVTPEPSAEPTTAEPTEEPEPTGNPSAKPTTSVKPTPKPTISAAPSSSPVPSFSPTKARPYTFPTGEPTTSAPMTLAPTSDDEGMTRKLEEANTPTLTFIDYGKPGTGDAATHGRRLSATAVGCQAVAWAPGECGMLLADVQRLCGGMKTCAGAICGGKDFVVDGEPACLARGEMDFAAAPRTDVYALSKETAPALGSTSQKLPLQTAGSEVLQVLQDIWRR